MHIFIRSVRVHQRASSRACARFAARRGALYEGTFLSGRFRRLYASLVLRMLNTCPLVEAQVHAVSSRLYTCGFYGMNASTEVANMNFN